MHASIPGKTRLNDSVHFFVNELTSRIVAESGIPSDRFHLGKVILQSLKDAPDFVSQIDGNTNESETNRSVLERSIRCATAFRNMGLKRGDVIIMMAPNYLDLCIPYYAALYLGVITAPIDMTLTVNELQDIFKIDEPKMIFCQSQKTPDIVSALNNLNLNSHIVTLDKESGPSRLMNICNFPEFLNKHGKCTSVDDFKAADFDPVETIALLTATSGTTGLPKQAALTHKNLTLAGPYIWCRYSKFPTPIRMILVTSPLQWISGILHFYISPIMRYTRLQSSKPATQQHVYHLINTYKPTYMILSPNLLTTLIKPGDRDQCDFTCFEHMCVGGSAVPSKLIEEVKQIIPQAEVLPVYGATEVCTYFVFHANYMPPGSCGQPLGWFNYRLVDVEKGEDILEPHIQGELWLQGQAVFKGYYKNPGATKEVFADGNWFKTGDMFYRDDGWNFYFVDRIKMLLKYYNHQVSPVEIENVIRQHAGVLDVAVTSVPDAECGDLIVACVVRRPGFNVTAQEIKDLVKSSLTDTKQLRGGVVFLNELPALPNSKLNRRKLKEVVLQVKRE